MSDINYSIIIPHRNSPQLLQRCIESIPIRNDIEIIVIDDFSDTKRIDTQLFPRLNQENTYLLHLPENKGAGYARNIGLQKASGKWLIFADADDYFLPDAFTIFDNYRESTHDVILFKNDSSCKGVYINKLIDHFFNQNIDEQHALMYAWAPWAKLVRHDYVKNNHFKFETTLFSNDVFWNVQLASNTKKIKIDGHVVYKVTERDGSLTTYLNKNAFITRFKVALHSNQYLFKSNNKNLMYPATTVFADWAREFGIHFYLKFLFCSWENLAIEKEARFESQKISQQFRNKHPILYLSVLAFIPGKKSLLFLYDLSKKFQSLV